MTKLFTQWSGLALVLASTGALARELPNYEVLQDLPSAAPSRTSRSLHTLPRLAQTPEVRVAHRDARRDLPTFLWAAPRSTPTPQRVPFARMKPEEAAREQLGQYLSLYGHKSLAAAGASVSSVSQDASGVKVVTFAQQVDGVEVFRQALKVLLNARNEVVALSGNLSPYVFAGTSATQTPGLRSQLSAAQAIAVAYRDLTGAALDSSLLSRRNVRAEDTSGYTHYELAAYARPLAEGLVIPARARSVFFPMSDGLVPAYYLELNTAPEGSTHSDYYAYVVSAADGRLLVRHNLTAHSDFSYRVWADTTPPYTPQDGPSGGTVTPHPTGTPGTVGTPPFVAPALVTLRNTPFSANDPWLPSGATKTLGNNVEAYADLVAPDGFGTGDLFASVTAPGVFDRTLDFTLQPNANAEQVQAATTQLFYVNNWLHDWFYDSGFNEAARNAQADNFGRGGLGRDAILAEAQDYGGTDNANMATPADGASPRMQMYLFTAPTPGLNQLSLEATAPASVAGKYSVGTASFGAQVFDVPATEVVIATSGASSDSLGCTALTNAAAVSGKIAYVDRGTCPFTTKATHAQAAGAVGLIIGNNVEGLVSPSGTDAAITLPTLAVGLSDARKLRGAVPGLTAKLHREAVPALDGTIDNGIVAHEWGHYISNRLVWNASGLSNHQGRSMGEGWADFHALLMIAREGDIHVPANANWNGVYTAAEYATRGAAVASEDTTFFGIRRVGYSADLTKNALTFKHIADGEDLPATAPLSPNGSTNAEVHNAGEIWATMLWDCYVSLLRAHPFIEAQQRMKQYLVNGYKLTPATPTFLEARDALIAAAYASDIADGQRFWKAFARRGAGVGALAPDALSTDHKGLEESYAETADVSVLSVSVDAPGNACDGDAILDNGETGLLRIRVRNLGPTRSTETVATVISPSQGVTLGNLGKVRLPALDVRAEADVTVPVTLHGVTGRQLLEFYVTTTQGTLSRPGDRTGALAVWANYDEAPATKKTEDVQSTQLPWRVQHDTTLDNIDWGVDFFPNPADRIFYAPDADGPSDMSLITPPLHVSPTEPFVLTFKQFWDFETAYGNTSTTYYDGAVIELSQDDGQTWTDVGASLYTGKLFSSTDGLNPLQGRDAVVGRSPGFPAFVTSTLNLGVTYAGKTVRLRFRAGSDINTGTVGWVLDDLAFSGITHTPFTTVREDDQVCVVLEAPLVVVEPDFPAPERTTQTLHGRATDPHGAALTYLWEQMSGPAVQLSDVHSPTPTFVTPEVTASTALEFRLTVNNRAQRAHGTVKVTVTNVNRAPVALTEAARTIEGLSAVRLDASGSTDPDGDSLSYTWTQLEGPAVTLVDANTATPSFTVPQVTSTTTLRFRLVVKDGESESEPVFISLTLKANTTPKPQEPTDIPGSTTPVTPTPARSGCSSTGSGLPMGLLGLALLALARRRRELN